MSVKKKFKVVYVISTYTKNMGYIYVCLPEAMSRIENTEVHVVTSQAQMYYDSPYYKDSYQDFHGDPILPEGKEELANNLYLHRLKFDVFKTELYIKGLYKKLKEINPDVVHTFDCNSINSFKLAVFKPFIGYKYFPGNSIVLSVFPLDKNWKNLSNTSKISWYLKHIVPGKFISMMASIILPSTIDAAYIAEKYLGASKSKILVSPLGVDTELFRPVGTNEKIELRRNLGLKEDAFVCIYTGRMTKEKNPLILAKAIEWINNNSEKKVFGLFLGAGEQKDEISLIENVQVVDFQAYRELPKYYQASDVGVWPTQESTSMIDAASCGIPIIVSSELKAIERVDGNGLQYKENDLVHLAENIMTLVNNSELAKQLGAFGAAKMEQEYSWNKIAKQRFENYTHYLINDKN